MTRAAWLLTALVLLGAALRLFHLGEQSLWVDEAVTLRFARYPLADLIGQMLAHHEVHPPLYDAVLHLWSEVGQGELWIRLPSAIAGITCIGMVYWLSREIGNDAPVSLVATALFTVSGFGVFIAQEAKSYAFGMLFSLIATALFARLLRAPSRAVAAPYAAACVLGFYTHYLTALLWPGHVIAALCAQRPRAFWTSFVGGVGAVLLAIAPWVVVVKAQAGAQDLSLFRKAVPADLVMTPVALLYGTDWQLPEGIAGPVVAGVLLLLGAALALLGAVRLGRPQGVLLGLSAVLPSLFLFGVSSTTSMHIFWPKYVSFGLAMMHVLIARGLASLPRRWMAVVAGLAVVGVNVFSLRNLYFDRAYHNQDWRSVVGYFARTADAKRDAVVIVPSMMVLPFRYYYPGPAPLVGLDGVDEAVLTERLRGARHVWLCMPPAHPLAARGDVASWFEAHGRRLGGVQTQSAYADNALLLVEYQLDPLSPTLR